VRVCCLGWWGRVGVWGVGEGEWEGWGGGGGWVQTEAKMRKRAVASDEVEVILDSTPIKSAKSVGRAVRANRQASDSDVEEIDVVKSRRSSSRPDRGRKKIENDDEDDEEEEQEEEEEEDEGEYKDEDAEVCVCVYVCGCVIV